MAVPRDNHTATLLLNGKVLVTGGLANGNSGPLLASAELFDPDTGIWTPAGSMISGRHYHIASLLADGRVLVIGGHDIDYSIASTELYDPSTGTWRATSPLGTSRFVHTATLLPDGKVLAAGGSHSSPAEFTHGLSSAEIYDATTGSWVTTTALNAARDGHTATLLPNGNVFLAAGYYEDQNTSVWLSSAEVYDSAPGPIILGNPVKLRSGAVQFAFTSTANQTNTILAATTPASPLTDWTTLGVATEFAPGLYVFSDPQVTNIPERFYRVRVP
jgi:hypothetical protein